MYSGGITYLINKSFGSLQLVPEAAGLRLCYTPFIDGRWRKDAPGFLDLLVPLDAVGGLWATCRAFLESMESLDENVIMKNQDGKGDTDILIKLYRDKPNGNDGRLSGDETCWLRLVTGRTEEERRRIKLGPRDLICFDLACRSVLSLATTMGTHKPEPFDPSLG
jgi:hypothetical protein